MPSEDILISGREQIVEFFATVPAGGRLDLIPLTVTRANGHLALAAYLPDRDAGRCRGYGVMVYTVTGDRIDTITGSPDPELFRHFDLPETHPDL